MCFVEALTGVTQHMTDTVLSISPWWCEICTFHRMAFSKWIDAQMVPDFLTCRYFTDYIVVDHFHNLLYSKAHQHTPSNENRRTCDFVRNNTMISVPVLSKSSLSITIFRTCSIINKNKQHMQKMRAKTRFNEQ